MVDLMRWDYQMVGWTGDGNKDGPGNHEGKAFLPGQTEITLFIDKLKNMVSK